MPYTREIVPCSVCRNHPASRTRDNSDTMIHTRIQQNRNGCPIRQLILLPKKEHERMGNRKKPPPIIQPVKCRGCIWGRWQETIQVCSRVRCVKGEEMAGKTNQAFSYKFSASTTKPQGTSAR